MVELLLVQRNAATDGPTATAAMQAVFGVGRVTVEDGSLSWEQRSLVDDGISATQITSRGAAIHVQAAAAPDLVVFVVHSGSVEIRPMGQTVALAAVRSA